LNNFAAETLNNFILLKLRKMSIKWISLFLFSLIALTYLIPSDCFRNNKKSGRSYHGISSRKELKWNNIRPTFEKKSPIRVAPVFRASGEGFDGGNGGDINGLGEVDDNDDNRKLLKSSNGLLIFLTSLLENYSDALEKYPYPTKIITSGMVGGLGDFLIQNLQNRGTKRNFDFRRLFVFMLVTGFYIAPVMHVWFNLITKIPLPPGANKFVEAGLMMALDQTFGAVFVTIGFFYAFELVSESYLTSSKYF
jgi:hypothetical protein